MPYIPVTYNTGAGPGIDGPACNTWETQYQEASLSYGPDLFTPFILTGCAGTKDGGTPTRLDIAAGTAYVLQADGTLRQRVIAAQNVSTVGQPSATLYVGINADGSIYFHAAAPSSPVLTICTVTTDASANILSVTDTRMLNTTLLPAMAGILKAAGLMPIGAHNTASNPSISFVTGTPSSLGANEVAIQLS